MTPVLYACNRSDKWYLLKVRYRVAPSVAGLQKLRKSILGVIHAARSDSPDPVELESALRTAAKRDLELLDYSTSAPFTMASARLSPNGSRGALIDLTPGPGRTLPGHALHTILETLLALALDLKKHYAEDWEPEKGAVFKKCEFPGQEGKTVAEVLSELGIRANGFISRIDGRSVVLFD